MGLPEEYLARAPWPLARLARAALVLRFQLWRAARHRSTVLEWIGNRPIVVLPDVFNPALFYSSKLMLDYLGTLPRPEGTRHGRALDLGTGSGVLGIALAGRTGRVIATDVNPEAIRCTEINVRLSHVEDRVEIRAGDLFEAVGQERFDLIVFNPPFFAGQGSDWLERAFFGSDVVERFLGEVAQHLAPPGQALLVFSTAGDLELLRAAVARYPLATAIVARRRLLCETLFILQIRPLPEAVHGQYVGEYRRLSTDGSAT